MRSCLLFLSPLAPTSSDGVKFHPLSLFSLSASFLSHAESLLYGNVTRVANSQFSLRMYRAFFGDAMFALQRGANMAAIK